MCKHTCRGAQHTSTPTQRPAVASGTSVLHCPNIARNHTPHTTPNHGTQTKQIPMIPYAPAWNGCGAPRPVASPRRSWTCPVRAGASGAVSGAVSGAAPPYGRPRHRPWGRPDCGRHGGGCQHHVWATAGESTTSRPRTPTGTRTTAWRAPCAAAARSGCCGNWLSTWTEPPTGPAARNNKHVGLQRYNSRNTSAHPRAGRRSAAVCTRWQSHTVEKVLPDVAERPVAAPVPCIAVKNGAKAGCGAVWFHVKGKSCSIHSETLS